jgi:hypothetical protein
MQLPGVKGKIDAHGALAEADHGAGDKQPADRGWRVRTHRLHLSCFGAGGKVAARGPAMMAPHRRIARPTTGVPPMGLAGSEKARRYLPSLPQGSIAATGA